MTLFKNFEEEQNVCTVPSNVFTERRCGMKNKSRENQNAKYLWEISKFAGMREDLVQAGGGNSSVKMDDDRMIIKASGVQMADVTETTGYSIVRYRVIRQYMEEILEHTNAYTADEILEKTLIEGNRPSIETFLHAITGRVTLHTHPVSVNVLAARAGGMETLRELFPEALTVGYATPGLDLARLYYQTYLAEKKRRGTSPEFQVIFLKNHGLVVSGDTAEQVITETERVCRTVELHIGMDNSCYRKAYEIYMTMQACGLDDGKIVVKVENKTVLDTYERLGHAMWNHQVCPDCVVFCGRKAFRYEGPESLAERLDSFLRTYGEPVIIQSGDGLFIRADSVKKAREIESVLMFSARIAVCNTDHTMDLLTEEEQGFLLNWDAEKYRRNIQ